MSFEAQYRTEDGCDSCGGDIGVGQEIDYTASRHLVHVTCPTKRAFRPPCPRCWLELPATGVCPNCDG